jgi:hypothetical protein
MRVSNFGQNIDPKMTIRLIRGSTYTRVYTVYVNYQIGFILYTKSLLEMCSSPVQIHVFSKAEQFKSS